MRGWDCDYCRARIQWSEREPTPQKCRSCGAPPKAAQYTGGETDITFFFGNLICGNKKQSGVIVA